MNLLDLPVLVLDRVFDFLEGCDYETLPYGSSVAAYSTTPALDTHVHANLACFALCSRRAHEIVLPRLFRRVSLVDRPLHHLLFAVAALLPKYGHLVRELSICLTIYFVEHPGLDPEDSEILNFLESTEWGHAAYLLSRFHPRSLPSALSKDRCHASDLAEELGAVLQRPLAQFRHVCADDPIQCNYALREARLSLVRAALTQCTNLRAIKRMGTRLIQIADVSNAPSEDVVYHDTERLFARQLEQYELYDFRWNGFSRPNDIPRHLSTFSYSLRSLVLRDSGDGGDLWSGPDELPSVIFAMRRLERLEIQSPNILPDCLAWCRKPGNQAQIAAARLRHVSLPRHSECDAHDVLDWLTNFKDTLQHVELGRGKEFVPTSVHLAEPVCFPHLRTLLDVGGTFAHYLLTCSPTALPLVEHVTIVIERRIGLAPDQFVRTLVESLKARARLGLSRLTGIDMRVIQPWARQSDRPVDEMRSQGVDLRIEVLPHPREPSRSRR